MPNTIIIGGGISGLATAHYLQKAGIDCTVLEAATRCGGKIVSERSGEFLVEGGPDSVLTQKPWANDLCREIGLEDQLQPTRPEFARILFLHKGELVPLPEGMMLMIPTDKAKFLLTRLISPQGKLRMLQEAFIRRRKSTEDESLASFIKRRFGQECLDTIAGPLLGSIYMTPPERLSMRCAFPRFIAAEQKHGSLIKSMLSAPKPKGKTSMFTTLRDGMQVLTDTLAERLANCIETGVTVTGLERTASGYIVRAGDRQWAADRVVVTCPALPAADLSATIAPDIAAELRSVSHVSTATVSLGYGSGVLDASQIPNGTGFIVPDAEQRQIMACTWASNKFEHRAPEGGAVVRAFMGGPSNSELVTSSSDDELVAIVRGELKSIIGIDAVPALIRVSRWEAAHPQYELGHLERIERIEAAAANLGSLHFCGWPYRGNGIPDCVRCAKELAKEIQSSSEK